MGSVFEHVHFSEFPKCGENKDNMWTQCGTWSKMWTKCGKYMEHIQEIYMEYIWNVWGISIDIYDRKRSETQAPPSAAAPLGLCFWSFYIIDIYGYSLYIPYIFHIYFLAMFHIFSLVCFLIYGVKSRSGHDRSQSFGPISHVSGPEMVFWPNFIMILHHFCRRSSKITLFWPKTLIFYQKIRKYQRNSEK